MHDHLAASPTDKPPTQPPPISDGEAPTHLRWQLVQVVYEVGGETPVTIADVLPEACTCDLEGSAGDRRAEIERVA